MCEREQNSSESEAAKPGWKEVGIVCVPKNGVLWLSNDSGLYAAGISLTRKQFDWLVENGDRLFEEGETR